MTVYTVQPTLDTSAYSTGDVVDDIQVLKGALSRDHLLVHIGVIDVDDEGVQYDFIFFDAEPSGTYTDNTAAAIDSADTSKVIGMASVLTSDYITVGTDKIAHKIDVNLVMNARRTDDLYVLIIVRGAPTFSAATDVTFKFGFVS